MAYGVHRHSPEPVVPLSQWPRSQVGQVALHALPYLLVAHTLQLPPAQPAVQLQTAPTEPTAQTPLTQVGHAAQTAPYLT